MLRLIFIVIATISAGCTCKYVPVSPKLAMIITAVWFYLAMDFLSQTLYRKPLYKCFFNGESTQYNR